LEEPRANYWTAELLQLSDQMENEPILRKLQLFEYRQPDQRPEDFEGPASFMKAIVCHCPDLRDASVQINELWHTGQEEDDPLVVQVSQFLRLLPAASPWRIEL